ncbi:TPA: hypothetical protein MAG46_005421 [Klebsiella pneumoniae]|nr:hypothetical protein [Klebsiella pneumoniae]
MKQELQATGIGFAALILAYPGLVTDMAGKIKDPVGISSQVSDRSGQPGSRAAGQPGMAKIVRKRSLSGPYFWSVVIFLRTFEFFLDGLTPLT